MTPASRRVAGELPMPMTHHASCGCGYDADLPKYEPTCPLLPVSAKKDHTNYACVKLPKPERQ